MPSTPDDANLPELQRLRQRVQQLEEQLASARAAERVRASENWLTTHLEQTPLACTAWDLNLRCIEWNPSAERIFGYTREEAIGRSAMELIIPSDVEAEVMEIVAQLREDSPPVHHVNVNVTKDGRRILCEWQNTPLVDLDGEPFYFVAMAQDITDRQRTEEQWKSVLAHAPDIIMLLDPEARIQLINRIEPGYSIDQVLNVPAPEFVAPEQRHIVSDAVQRVYETGETAEYEVQDVLNRHWFAARLAPIWQGEQVVSVVAIVTDVTEQKRSAELLRESEARFRQFSEAVPEVFCMFDPHEQKVLYVNDAYATMFGQPCDALYADASAWIETLHPEDRDMAIAWFAGIAERPRRDQIPYRVVRPDGIRYIEDECYPIYDEAGNVKLLAAVCIDVTEKKQAEIELLESKTQLERRVRERTAELASKNKELIEDIVQRKRVESQLRASQRRLSKQREVLRRLLDVHDRDIQLIAYELHDGIVQDMAGALMYLEASRHQVPADALDLESHIDNSMRVLRGAVDEARRIVNELRFTVLDEEGVIAAVQNLIDELSADGQLEVRFVHEVQFKRLAPTVEMAIYRIVQEGLNNVRRHSQSTLAKVTIRQVDQQVELTVQDWGAGFEPGKVRKKRYGLSGVKERARLLGGSAEIVTRLGQGTTISVELPLIDVLLHAGEEFEDEPEEKQNNGRSGEESPA